MGDLIWQLKQLIRKLIPLVIVGGIAYYGYTFYRQGVFRHGLKPAITTMLHRIPYFGSHFRHFSVSNEASYVAAAPSHHSYHGHHHHRRHHRHHRRHR